MGKKDNSKLVPRLRFPEFRDQLPWETRDLADILTSISNGCSLPQNGSRSGQKVTRIESISNGHLDLDRVGYVDASKEELSEYKLNIGDILFSNINSLSHIGKSVFIDVDEDLYHGMNLLRLQVNTTAHFPKFVSYALNTTWIREAIRSKANKAINQASINQATLGEIALLVPHLHEQVKISKCLGSLDELIAAQGRKVEALKEHKRGLMLELFPREGERVPRVRFPEFQDGDEWETERMEKLYSFKRHNIFSRDKLNYEIGTAKNIHYGDIHTKFPVLLDLAEECVPYINSSEELPEEDSEDFCAEGDIVFADASEDMDDVGKSIEIVGLNGELLLSGQHTILARQKDSVLIVGFGGYLFRSDQIRFQIQKEAQGTKVYSISSTRLANILITFPGDREEQRSIASCLSSLDCLIAAESRKLEALKTHKKGLMQGLFPMQQEV